MTSGHADPAAVVAVAIITTVLACIFVAMRLYARICLARSAGWDDLCITFSMLFAIATMVVIILQVETGMGRHSKDIEPHELTKNLKAFWVSLYVYNISLTLSKVSILIQYLRIFPQRWFRISTWCLMAFIIAYGTYAVLTAIFLCWPIAYFWDRTIEGGKCLNQFAIWFTNAGLNIATDIATTILPLPVLNALELPRRQRRALMLVFGLGGFTCIISILRLQSLYVIANAEDVSWENPLAAIWSAVEMNTAIIASCGPTIRRLFPALLKATSIGGSLSHTNPDTLGRTGGSKGPWTASGTGAGTSGTHSSNKSPFTSMMKSGRNHNLPPPVGAYHSMPENDSRGDGFIAPKSGLLVGKSKSHIRAQDSMDDIELHQHMPFPQGKIHVMTSIEQATDEMEREKSRDGDGSESTKELVRERTHDRRSS
ncbi:hypothetical protein CKM354_000428500 [Cercospora kikuchii]|uniref:Rhodopsin domain-containing protein n=1 Tax=Cercospora kikuchii TaxID=84275 RepID=A0A9P3FFZ7_9PEZI|nr:uncharacterized protein CKM354_000428500 [Cercospora kikuchii]GIZ40965.1 hypothetical protein CKM354_000428500 [Cercospora kikuchii]